MTRHVVAIEPRGVHQTLYALQHSLSRPTDCVDQCGDLDRNVEPYHRLEQVLVAFADAGPARFQAVPQGGTAVARWPGEQVEFSRLEALDEVGDPQWTDAVSGQGHGQRQAVEPTHELTDRLGVGQGVAAAGGTLAEQSGCVVDREGGEHDDLLVAACQWRFGRPDPAGIGSSRGPLLELRTDGNAVRLAIEDPQPRAGGQHQLGVSRPARLLHPTHELRIGTHLREIDPDSGQ